jgi:hypothetical protein
VVRALGLFKHEKASQALQKLAVSDPSYFVEAEATQAWASSMDRPHASTEERRALSQLTEKFLIEQLVKPSFRELIRAAALRALAQVPGLGRGECPQGLRALMDYARVRKNPLDARMAAVEALGVVARSADAATRAQVFEVLSALSEESNFRIRMVLVHALDSAESSQGIGLLSRIQQTDPDGRIKRACSDAISRLQTAGSTPASVAELQASLAKLQEEQKKLLGWVEELRAAKPLAH